MPDGNGSPLSEKTLKEAVRLGQLIGEPKNVNGIPYAIVPMDAKVEDLSRFLYNEHAERPPRKKGTVRVHDAEGFVEYWKLFGDEHSRAFADETKSTVVGILDYHTELGGPPRWGQHRVRLDLKHSEEWIRWMAHNGQKNKMTQLEFGEFIEDRQPDIVEPNAATMLELARSLTAKTEMDFSSAVRMNNGSVQFRYTEQVKGTFGAGNLEVPEKFVIAIPVYLGLPREHITVRLRYRVLEGKLTFWIDLLQVEAIEHQAFLAMRDRIQGGIPATIINGAPPE